MELFRALASLVEAPSERSAPIAELLELGPPPSDTDYTETFLLQLYPYASVYLGAEGMLGGEARDRIAGFWRALGETPPAEPDHLAVLLALYARLGDLEKAAAEVPGTSREATFREVPGTSREVPGTSETVLRWRHARRVLLWEHLLSWLPIYLRRLHDSGAPFYRRWAELLGRGLLDQTRRLEPPTLLPLHLRQAPPLDDPRDGDARAFLRSLLSPVRSGLILTRQDLVRAGRELGIGVRLGERRFVLETLLDQAPAALLGWLAAEASRQAAATTELPEAYRETGDFWRRRALETVRLVEHLRRDL